LIVGQAHVVAARLNDKPAGSRSAAILKRVRSPTGFGTQANLCEIEFGG
jgi:hypothetical protein